MKKIIPYFVMPLFFFLWSCDESEENSPAIPDAKPIVLRSELQPRIQQDNAFAFALFKSVCDSEPKPNVFVSPLSVSMALSMAMNGARNETLVDMETALHVSGFSAEEMNEYCKTLREALLKADPSTQLSIVNSIWYRWGYPIENNFLQINKDYFNAEIKEADFEDPITLQRINKWCADNTNNKITQVLESVSPNSIMYLINAVYFKGIWRSRFLKEDTRLKPFYAETSQQNIPMMSQKSGLNYVSDEIAGYLELPYGNNAFSMIVMLPHDGKTTADLIENLNPETWSNMQNHFAGRKVNLEFPRFRMECKYKLEKKEILPAMGMRLPFTEWADFTGISRGGGLSFSEVIHKTYLEVNETGTEAAVVTAAGIIGTAAPGVSEVDFIVNKPFLFAIQEKSTGVILFMGKVAEIKE